MYERIAKNKRFSVGYAIIFFFFWTAVGALIGLLVTLFSSGRRGGRQMGAESMGRHDMGGYATASASSVNFGQLLAANVLNGAVIAAIVAALGVLFAFTSGAKVVLSISGAQRVDHTNYANLMDLVEALAIGEGMPTPEVYVIDDPAPNAFSTGTSPKKAAITVTSGLLAMMNREELEGVLAHEMSHIKNYDVRLLLIIGTLIGLAGMISSAAFRSAFYVRGGRDSQSVGLIILLGGALMAVFALALGPLVKMALSRQRESLADVSAVELTRNPSGLLSALRKLQAVDQPMRKTNEAMAAMCITDPHGHTENKDNWLRRMYDSHPPLAERIAVLEQLESGQSGPIRPGTRPIEPPSIG